VKYHVDVPFKTTILLFLPFPTYFLCISIGQTHGPILMVDGSSDAFWLKEVPFGYANDEKILLGGL